MNPLMRFALTHAEQASLDDLERIRFQVGQNKQQPVFGWPQGAVLIDGRVHPQLWRALSVWRTDQHRLCRIDGQSGDQQALLQEAADAVDETWGAPAVADPGESPESGTRGRVPAVVPGSAGRGGVLGGRASGGLTPRFLMLSHARSTT